MICGACLRVFNMQVISKIGHKLAIEKYSVEKCKTDYNCIFKERPPELQFSFNQHKQSIKQPLPDNYQISD
jgi:hypothetical protein